MIGEISIMLGLKVYTDEGRYVGTVRDIVLDIEKRKIESLAISDFNKTLIDSKAKGVLLPYRLVKAVGDIVIIKDVFRKAEKNKDHSGGV
ncbi:MAG: photosystem reaction center subunit H [Archaeoglobales archaeon]|nr:MAG: photosystem reaction center subunit H [Archaeoglobales archaeon]